MNRFLFTCVAAIAVAGLISCSGGSSGGSSAQGYVSYDANGATSGSVPADQSGDVGKTVNISANTGNLAKTGYLFDGWNSKADGSGSAFAPGTKIKLTEGVFTLFAKWKAKSVDPTKYTVSFFAESGTTAYASVLVVSGSAVGTLPTEPTKTGYRFEGWWTGENGGGTRITATTIVTANMSAYAKWVQETTPQVTVTYSADGGLSTYATATVEQGSSAGSLPADPSKSGYAFAGWWTGVNGTGTAFTSSTAIAVDQTVYAKWTLRAYAITYDVAGGENNPLNPVSYTIESPLITLLSPSKSGFDFVGWYSESGFVTKITTIPSGSTGVVSLFAKWKPKSGLSVTVSIPGDGSIVFSPANLTVTVGEILTVTATGGYESYAWYMDGGLVDLETSSSIIINSEEFGASIIELMVVVTDSNGLVSSGNCRIHFEN